jgi:hypothetical protein
MGLPRTWEVTHLEKEVFSFLEKGCRGAGGWDASPARYALPGLGRGLWGAFQAEQGSGVTAPNAELTTMPGRAWRP